MKRLTLQQKFILKIRCVQFIKHNDFLVIDTTYTATQLFTSDITNLKSSLKKIPCTIRDIHYMITLSIYVNKMNKYKAPC